MKRSELTVGAELYYAERYDWGNNHPADGTYAGWRLGKATVLAVEPYAHETYGFGRRIRQTGRGNGVLVEIAGHQRLVQLANLRGPYEQTLAEVKERYARDQELAARQQDVREQRTARVNAVVKRLTAAGAPSAHRAGYDSGSIVVLADELVALLDRLDEAYTRGVEAGREAGQLEAG